MAFRDSFMQDMLNGKIQLKESTVGEPEGFEDFVKYVASDMSSTFGLKMEVDSTPGGYYKIIATSKNIPLGETSVSYNGYRGPSFWGGLSGMFFTNVIQGHLRTLEKKYQAEFNKRFPDLIK